MALLSIHEYYFCKGVWEEGGGEKDLGEEIVEVKI